MRVPQFLHWYCDQCSIFEEHLLTSHFWKCRHINSEDMIWLALLSSEDLKSRKVYCSDWSRWLISVVWVVRVARVVPIVFPEAANTFSRRDFENWTNIRKVGHQCCETMEPMLETMEQTHKTLTTQNGFSRHFVVLHIQPISHWTIQLAIIIKTITIIAIHGMIQLTIN